MHYFIGLATYLYRKPPTNSSEEAYILSAWVYVESGEFAVARTYRRKLTDEIPFQLAETPQFIVKKVSVASKSEWQKITMEIDPQNDLDESTWNAGAPWCARIYFGYPFVGRLYAGKTYIDDIRIYPANSFVSTKYYNNWWRMPRLSVGANDKAGQLAEYDTLGRPVAMYKIDKTKSAQDSGFQTIMKGNRYHLIGDELSILTPNGGEELRAGSQYTLSWWPGKGKLGAGGVDIRYFDGTNWGAVASGVTGCNAYVWTVPSGAKTGCKIKVISNDDTSKWDASDTTFSIFTNSAPSAPLLVSPVNGYEDSTGSALLKWNTSVDPEGSLVTYRVEMRRNGAATWTTIVDNYADTQQTVTLPGIGPYEWTITASDGSLSKYSGVGTFYSVPSDFFVIRDIQNKIVQVIQSDLYTAIYNTLSAVKRSAFANTYRDTTAEPGGRVFADRYYFSSKWSPYDTTTKEFYTTNFRYRVYHTNKDKKDKWLDWVGEGKGTGYTGLTGGGGCSIFGGEMRNIAIGIDMANRPKMTFTYNWACPSGGTKTYSWGDEGMWTGGGDNAIMRIKWEADTALGYHTWYMGWNRGGENLGWRSDGQWTGAGDRKLDKIWLRMYKYKPN